MNCSQLHELGVELGPGGVHSCTSCKCEAFTHPCCTPGFYGRGLEQGSETRIGAWNCAVTAFHGFAVDVKGKQVTRGAGEL